MALVPHSFPLFNNPLKPQKHICPFRINPRISCQLSKTTQYDDEDKKFNNGLELLKLSVTLTVISTALPQPAVAAKVAEKKRSTKKTAEALTPEQFKLWSQGLPIVRERLPFTDVLNLKEEGKLKHIMKPPNASLRQNPECILVILDDSRVLRTVLPSLEGNAKFWSKWDELNIDPLCINAYSPTVKKLDFPSPYLGFLSRIPFWVISLVKPKPQSKKALELKKMREELKKMREEREMMEKMIKKQKKMDKRTRKRELQKMKYESFRHARKNYKEMGKMWSNLASDPNVATGLGIVFFYIFYRVVVLNYRKQRKDYEDRVKIEIAEAEERKKMRELERKMQGLEDVEDEEEGKGGEQNPYMKVASQFMKSGARVRRARNKRLPQYLERDVDVKFSDVAGLGKIQLELEEIVKFFTHAEMYR